MATWRSFLGGKTVFDLFLGGMGCYFVVVEMTFLKLMLVRIGKCEVIFSNMFGCSIVTPILRLDLSWLW